MVLSFIKKQLEGLKTEDEIIHLLTLANPDLTDNRINKLMNDAKQKANIPVIDEKIVKKLQNAAREGEHTTEALLKVMPDANIQDKMRAKNILYAERNEELFPIINSSILDRTVTRKDGKLEIKNVNSVMNNFRMANSRAEPQSVAMAIKNFERIRTTRSHKAGGSINSLNPYLLFAKPVIRTPKWTGSFKSYQQNLKNAQLMRSLIPNSDVKSFKHFNIGGAVGKSWINPTLQRSAQQSALKLSQMRSVNKLNQLREQAQQKQEYHNALQSRIAESTSRLLAMRRSTQSRIRSPQPNYDNLINPSNISLKKGMMNLENIIPQSINQLSPDNYPGLLQTPGFNVIRLSDTLPVITTMHDASYPHGNDSSIVFNFTKSDNSFSFDPVLHKPYAIAGSPNNKTYTSQHMIGIIPSLSELIPSGETGIVKASILQDKFNIDKLLAHDFKKDLNKGTHGLIYKKFQGIKLPGTPVPSVLTNVPSKVSQPDLLPDIDSTNISKLLDPHTIGDTEQRGFRLVHFKPGDKVSANIVKYIRDISQEALNEGTGYRGLDEIGSTGSRFAYSNLDIIYNYLNRSDNMGYRGLVLALNKDTSELMSSLRYTHSGSRNSTYVDLFGTRGNLRGKGIGSHVFVEAMKHSLDLGVTDDFSLSPLQYRQTMDFYRKHGMDRTYRFNLQKHVPRLLAEQQNKLSEVPIDDQIRNIHGNTTRPETVMNRINENTLNTLKHRYGQFNAGGLIPRFAWGGGAYGEIQYGIGNKYSRKIAELNDIYEDTRFSFHTTHPMTNYKKTYAEINQRLSAEKGDISKLSPHYQNEVNVIDKYTSRDLSDITGTQIFRGLVGGRNYGYNINDFGIGDILPPSFGYNSFSVDESLARTKFMRRTNSSILRDVIKKGDTGFIWGDHNYESEITRPRNIEYEILDKFYPFKHITGPEQHAPMIDVKSKVLKRALGGMSNLGVPAFVSAKEAYLPPKISSKLGINRLDKLRSMADDSTLMNDIPELQMLFGGMPDITNAGIFKGGSGNPVADDIFTFLEPGSYVLDYQTLEAMRSLKPNLSSMGGLITSSPIKRALGGQVYDKSRAFLSNIYNEYKYPYQAEQTKVGSSIRLQTEGYGTMSSGVYIPDVGVDTANQSAIDNYQIELENWAISTFKHLDPEDALNRVSSKLEENRRNIKKGSGVNVIDVEETFKTLKPEVLFDTKDLEKLGISADDLTESFKTMTDNAFRDPNNRGRYFKTLNLSLIETEKHVKNTALEFTALGKFSANMKDFSFRLASVSMAAMGVNFSTMAIFQTLTSSVSQLAGPFSDLESLMQNVGYLKAFGEFAGVSSGAVNKLTSDTSGLIDTWKRLGGMSAYMQLSFANIGKSLFSNEEMMKTFADGIETVFNTLNDPTTIDSISTMFISMLQSLPVLAEVISHVADMLKLVADQPTIMKIMMYSTIFSMLIQPIFSLSSALLTFVGIGAGFLNWSRGAVLAIRAVTLSVAGLNSTLIATALYIGVLLVAWEGLARLYEVITKSQMGFKPSTLIMGAFKTAATGDDFVEGPGNTNNDKVPYLLSRGERVVPAHLNAKHYTAYEQLETASTGEDVVGGVLPNITDYRYYEGIKTTSSIDSLKAGQDTAETLTAAREGNALRVIVKNAKDFGIGPDELSDEGRFQFPLTMGNPQWERVLNPAKGLKLSDIKLDWKPDWKPDVKPDIKSDVKPDFKIDLKSDLKPDIKLDVKSDVKPDVKPIIDEDWKPDIRYFDYSDKLDTKSGFDFAKIIPDFRSVTPDFAKGDITKSNIFKSIMSDTGKLKTGAGMLSYANPLDMFSMLNILNAGRFGTDATVAETINQVIGGAITGTGAAASLVGGGMLKTAGFARTGAMVALPGQVISKAALPLAAATPFMIGAEGAMATRRFMEGESPESIKMTPFDELSTIEKMATIATGGIGTSGAASGIKVLSNMYGEESARTSLTKTQQLIDNVTNIFPGLQGVNSLLNMAGGPSLGEIGVGGAMTLVGLPEIIGDLANAISGLPGWIADIMKPEDEGDKTGINNTLLQSYGEMVDRIDMSDMQYVGKTDELVASMNRYIELQQSNQSQQTQLNPTFIINAQPDVADEIRDIIDNALRSNGFYDGQRS